MQTFGFARIYDRKVGDDALAGRRLDWALNQLLYASPILAGTTMMAHVEDFEEYTEGVPHVDHRSRVDLDLGLQHLGRGVLHHERLSRGAILRHRLGDGEDDHHASIPPGGQTLRRPFPLNPLVLAAQAFPALTRRARRFVPCRSTSPWSFGRRRAPCS